MVTWDDEKVRGEIPEKSNEYIYLTNKITINQTAFCFTPQETAECLPDDADDGVHVNLCPIEI